MRFLSLLALAAASDLVAARSPRHAGKNTKLEEREAERVAAREEAKRQYGGYGGSHGGHNGHGHSGGYGGPPHSPPKSSNYTKFAVDGTKIPDVDFDIGESYAGLLPISSDRNASELYFWYFPTDNPDGKDDLTIWLNGGPGCSSLEGLLQENGPFLWQYGTYKPVKNPYTWVNLTNMVWVEQPVGTGFSQGTPTETNEDEVAASFLGFWKNFIDTFGLHNKKIYVTGESYAGYYVPYISHAMLEEENKDYFDVNGIMIYDPSTSYDAVQVDIPTVPFVDYHKQLFNLNATTLEYIHEKHESCGYAAFTEKYLTYPPPGPMPAPPSADDDESCALRDYVYNAVTLTNPCFDIYQVATTCPLLWDVLGFPGSIPYLPEGATIYFNRSDVQKAINAPIGEWEECSNGVLDKDTSLPSGLSVLPKVIEKTNNVIVSHGNLDMILLPNGTLIMIQNMTWNGQQGFQSEPKSPFYVPYHSELSLSTIAAAGVMGTVHTERGLTWVEVALSGHMVPQYAPSAAYRQMEFLLGRIDSLEEVSDFTTQSGNFGNDPSLLLGNGGIGSNFGGNKTKRMNRWGNVY